MANEHDLRYKTLFSHRIIVQRFLEGFVGELPSGRVDFESLRLVKTDTSDNVDGERRSDVFWSVKTNGGQRLYVLIEFQSTVAPWMPLRLATYVQRFYDTWTRSHSATEGLPAVLPILLYNGDDRWSVTKRLGDLVHPLIPDHLILSLDHIPVLINEIPHEDLARMPNALAAVFLAEKLTEKNLEQTVRAIVAIIKEEEPEAREAVAGWFASYFGADGTPEEIVAALEDVRRTRSMLQATLESWKQEGFETGRQQGREEGLEAGLQRGRNEGAVEAKLELARRMLERGDTIDQVIEITELPDERVRAIATEIVRQA